MIDFIMTLPIHIGGALSVLLALAVGLVTYLASYATMFRPTASDADGTMDSPTLNTWGKLGAGQRTCL